MASFNPYQPPVADIHHVGEAPPVDDEIVPPPTGLSRVVIGGLALTGLVSAVSIIADVSQLALLERARSGGVDMAEAEANDSRMLALMVAYLLSFLLTAGVFGMWLVRAARTARSLAADLVSNSPGWTVGWFFVPFANFFKPYTAVKDLWVASSSRDPRYGGDVPARFPLWWAAWLLSTAIGRVANQMAKNAGSDIPDLVMSTQLELFADVLRIALAVAAAAVVLAIAGVQERVCRGASR